MIAAYNRIDAKNDTIEVIREKVKALKKDLVDGVITEEQYYAEKKRVLADMAEWKSNYAFTW